VCILLFALVNAIGKVYGEAVLELVPSKVVPSKNSTLLIVPVPAVTAADNVIEPAAVMLLLEVAKVIVGGVAAMLTVTVTALLLVLLPLESVAFAV
jgi:hypothetical protein